LSAVAELNDTLSEIGVNLTLDQVAQRLNLSVDAARALVEAGLKILSEEAQRTQDTAFPSLG
jgi:hypothetical protein